MRAVAAVAPHGHHDGADAEQPRQEGHFAGGVHDHDGDVAAEVLADQGESLAVAGVVQRGPVQHPAGSGIGGFVGEVRRELDPGPGPALRHGDGTETDHLAAQVAGDLGAARGVAQPVVVHVPTDHVSSSSRTRPFIGALARGFRHPLGG
ncbi:hypothetical protein GCM10025789_07630 [Tessaracoccus lubricantis]|uniref:Uncharacterized protein n=1 Tax=Tessaracoccus lubricantis TaxID=545543 RepID=A0ABP9F3Y9_9ACTN